ncbi:hypothetical protein EI53_01912 [Fusobacterium naviforme]|nr:hypothetical protein EI53_01912 [Fusobacterium naviforme]STO27688.1 Phage tail sheath protein [Fusobacterium naviforme]
MSMFHAVNVTQQSTGVSTPRTAASGLPFVVGTAPVQMAEKPAAVNTPVLLTSWDEAVEKFGYSESWDTYTLCEFMYSHFVNFGAAPVVFVNVLDIANMKTAVSNVNTPVTAHKASITGDAIASSLVVKASEEGGATLEKDTDYEAYYSDGKLVIELISTSAHYSDAAISVSYDKVNIENIQTSTIVNAISKIDLCITSLGMVPDLICAPGWSDQSVVAAAMAAKAASVSGLCTAKALVDLTATSYDTAVTEKSTKNLVLPQEIVCWPMGKLGNLKFHMSTLMAGRMASTDTDNDGCPYESPSNKALPIDGICTPAGDTVELTLAQANVLNAAGITTAIHFINGWVAWGNYTAAYPANTDVKDIFIPVSRMFTWIGNSLIQTFWSRLDAPMNRRQIDSILDTCNIWLNGLTGMGYILGGRVEMQESENPTTNLMAGILKLHVYVTPPSPLQELDFVLEYDASYVEAALAG